MASTLDPIKAKLDALKAQAARLLDRRQAPIVILMQRGETVKDAIKRVCGDKGLPRVMRNGRPVPHIIVQGVEPTKKSTAEDR